MSKSRLLALSAVVAALALSGCQKNLLLVKRSVCPAVAVPNYAGDATLFVPGDTSGDARAIDLTATITDLRGDCVDTPEQLATAVNFKVNARRVNTSGARQVTLPFFATVVQGGNLIVSKQLGSVTLNFADGQGRAEAAGAANARVARSAACACRRKSRPASPASASPGTSTPPPIRCPTPRFAPPSALPASRSSSASSSTTRRWCITSPSSVDSYAAAPQNLSVVGATRRSRGRVRGLASGAEGASRPRQSLRPQDRTGAQR